MTELREQHRCTTDRQCIVCLECLRKTLLSQANKHLEPCCPYCARSASSLADELHTLQPVRLELERIRASDAKASAAFFCQQCGNQLEETLILAPQGMTIACDVCQYRQCLNCTLEAHPETTCSKAVDAKYTELKKVYSSVTLDPTLQFQMCVGCDKILRKAVKCNHYTCDSCLASFCMYCRQRYTDDHLNPFSEHACCLFKIGSKRSKPETADCARTMEAGQQDWGATHVTTGLVLLLLLAWVLLGLLIALIFTPYIGALKVSQQRTTVTERLRQPLGHRHT